MPNNNVKIAPSILSADFGHLAEQVAEATKAGADYIHVDIMDGHFVPNITIGPSVVAAIRPHTILPLDVHLMIEAPDAYIKHFAEAGADIITVHVETCPHLHRVIESVKELGIKAGAALNPATPLTAVVEVLPVLDLVLIMSVNPGFGGQHFIESTIDKIARMKETLENLKSGAELEVDGGINAEIAPRAVRAGAEVLVAGAAVYNKRESVSQALARIRGNLSGIGRR